MVRRALVFCGLLLLASIGHAKEAVPAAADPVLEARMLRIASEPRFPGTSSMSSACSLRVP